MKIQALFESLVDNFSVLVLPLAQQIFIYLSPIFAAIFLGVVFWQNWVRYVRLKTFLKLKYTLLELKLPKDTFKSPLAMETVLHAIHNTADGSVYAKYWNGETRPWYSLEIISVEGRIKFIIWTEDRRKNNLKSALYAQYPGIEIKEIDDYAKDVQYEPKLWKVWAAEFKFSMKTQSGAMPDVYPIKTYVDFGLDKDPKEEFKIDPLTQLLEWLGSLRPNEQAWFQFLIIAHLPNQKKSGSWWSQKHDKWKEDARKEINKLLMRDPKTKVAGEINPDTGFAKLPTFSEGERDVVKAIERKLQKLPFDVVIRGAYIAKRDIFDTPFGIGGIISSLKQFNSEHLNGFRPNGDKWLAKFDYPWQDYKGTRRNYQSRRFLMAYRRRSGFYAPFKTSSLILNTEELATIFHLPGSVAATPTLERVPSKKGEAPSNLPV